MLQNAAIAAVDTLAAAMTSEQIKRYFTYHPPKPNQVPRYEQIRNAGQAFAIIVNGLAPDSPELSVAIGKIREAVAWANAAIAVNEASAISNDGKKAEAK